MPEAIETAAAGTTVRNRIALPPAYDRSPTSAGEAARTIAGAWLPIIALGAAALLVDHWLPYLVAGALVGFRQIAVFNVMHEAVHGVLFANPVWNDRLGDFFGAAPLGTTVADYRRSHLAHHRFVGTDRDPDLATIFRRRRQDRLWPPTRTSAYRQLLEDVSGVTFLWNAVVSARRVDFLRTPFARGDQGLAERSADAGPSTGFATRLAVIGGLAVVAFGSGRWIEVIALWVLPLMTTFQVAMRLHQWGDHLGLEPVRGIEGTRHVVVGPLEQFLLAPTHSNFHLAHHLFPRVPHARLPAVFADAVAQGGAPVPTCRGYVLGTESVIAAVTAADEARHARVAAAADGR